MVDTIDPLEVAKKAAGYFFPGDINDPRINPEVRKRIALQLMARQRAVPKNLGEGINAVGEAIGDVRQQNRMLEQDAADNAALGERVGGIRGSQPPAGATPPVQAAALQPPQDETNAIVPPPVTTTPPINRSATPSPLPPNDTSQFASTGGVPPAPMPTPPGTVPSSSIPAPPGALPHTPLDARTRAAVALEMQRRMRPPNPTEAGVQAPAGDVLSGGGDPAAGIRKAPPPRTVAEDELQQEPLTPAQRRAIEAINARPWDRALQEAATKIYEQEEVGRAFRQSIRTKRYEELKKQQDPKYQAELEKLRLENTAARRPKLEEGVEDKTYFNEATQRYERPPMAPDLNAGDRMKDMTESQAKNLNFYEKGRRSLAILGDGQKLSGLWDTWAGAVPVVGNYLTSDDYKDAQSAAAEFANSVLRPETGATITDSDIKNVIARYFPKPGDPPAVAAQKRYLREGHLASLRDSLGKARPNADIFDRRFDAEHQRMLAAKEAAKTGGATPSTAADPLEGREAVFPDKSIRVRRNGKWELK